MGTAPLPANCMMRQKACAPASAARQQGITLPCNCGPKLATEQMATPRRQLVNSLPKLAPGTAQWRQIRQTHLGSNVRASLAPAKPHVELPTAVLYALA